MPEMHGCSSCHVLGLNGRRLPAWCGEPLAAGCWPALYCWGFALSWGAYLEPSLAKWLPANWGLLNQTSVWEWGVSRELLQSF